MRARDWSDTNAVAAAATGCQVCGRQGKLQRAHIIGRARDRGRPQAADVAMLCVCCHGLYDAHRLDIYPHLTGAQRARAVVVAGGAGMALRRLMGARWRTAPGSLLDQRLRELEDG